MTVDPDQARAAVQRYIYGARSDAKTRRSPRRRIALQCTLRRPRGSNVSACTRDVGPGGMCVRTSRPLRIDERLDFDLALSAEENVGGHARVLREQDFMLYALRFDGISESARTRLVHITDSASAAGPT